MIFEKLIRLFEQMTESPIPEGTVTLETSLKGDLAFTSLDMLWMAFSIEEQFHVVIDESCVPSLVTVGDVVKFIESNGSGE